MLTIPEERTFSDYSMGKYVSYEIHTASDIDMDRGEVYLWLPIYFSPSET
jgi:hypothetical protein